MESESRLVLRPRKISTDVRGPQGFHGTGPPKRWRRPWHYAPLECEQRKRQKAVHNFERGSNLNLWYIFHFWLQLSLNQPTSSGQKWWPFLWYGINIYCMDLAAFAGYYLLHLISINFFATNLWVAVFVAPQIHPQKVSQNTRSVNMDWRIFRLKGQGQILSLLGC